MPTAAEHSVLRVLDVSSIHVKPSDLNGPHCLLGQVSRYDEGGFFWVPSDIQTLLHYSEESLDYDGVGEREICPPYWYGILTLAMDHECTLVRIDCDGERIIELPDFEHEWKEDPTPQKE